MVIVSKTFEMEEGMFEHSFNSGINRMKLSNLVEKEEIIDNGDKYIHEVIFNTPVSFGLYLDKNPNHPADIVVKNVKYVCFSRQAKLMEFNENKSNEEFQYVNTTNFDSIYFTINNL